MADTTKKSRLPPESEDKVIEVSLKHVILGFTVVVTTAFVVGTGVVLLRDYVRYRRQKTCEVMRGAPLVLQGKHAGVEISIKPKYQSGSKSKMKPVGEPL